MILFEIDRLNFLIKSLIRHVCKALCFLLEAVSDSVWEEPVGGMVVALKKPGFFTANAQIDSPLPSHTLVEEMSSSVKNAGFAPLSSFWNKFMVRK